MDVGSVSSSTLSMANSLQPSTRSRSAELDPQAQQAQRAQSGEPAQGTTPADERTTRAVTEAEKTRPTVNINGQTVGSRVNTTA